jgi:hypothetical protein
LLHCTSRHAGALRQGTSRRHAVCSATGARAHSLSVHRASPRIGRRCNVMMGTAMCTARVQQQRSAAPCHARQSPRGSILPSSAAGRTRARCMRRPAGGDACRAANTRGCSPREQSSQCANAPAVWPSARRRRVCT